MAPEIARAGASLPPRAFVHTNKLEDRNSAPIQSVHAKCRPTLVEFEGILVIQLQLWILTGLQKQANADRKDVQFCAHKTEKDILGHPNDGLTANIETGIDHDRAA